MKVVLFCGGLGTRLRDYTETLPKPLVPIGKRPILWHLMKYYAHYKHNDFILCLGYRGEKIKEFFLNYNECNSNDFCMSSGGTKITLFNSDIQDWRITFVDTGMHANIGQRLKAVEKHIGDDELFLANYSDGLSELPLDHYINNFMSKGMHGSFLSVPIAQSFHSVQMGEDDIVKKVNPIRSLDLWVNGGYFVFRREIFDYLKEGEELVEEPFQRLITENKLMTHRYTGFWKAMDTFKDKMEYDKMVDVGNTPWQVWKNKE